MSEFEEVIRKRVKCCACEGSMAKGHINFIGLDRKATWKYPMWSNVLSSNRTPRASAIICDKCVKEHKLPKYAVDIDGEIVRYHKVKGLEKLPKLELDRE